MLSRLRTELVGLESHLILQNGQEFKVEEILDFSICLAAFSLALSQLDLYLPCRK